MRLDYSNHLIIPHNLGASTTDSSLGFGVKDKTLYPKQKVKFDPSVFPFVDFIPADFNNFDYSDYYCFYLDARNQKGVHSFYPIITSKVRFISGFDHPRPTNSGSGGGYQASVTEQNVQNQIELECQSLYNEVS